MIGTDPKPAAGGFVCIQGTRRHVAESHWPRGSHMSLSPSFFVFRFFLFYLIYFLFILLFVGKEGHGLGPRCPGLAICTPHFLLPFFICTPQS
jgi:hypothetical protein